METTKQAQSNEVPLTEAAALARSPRFVSAREQLLDVVVAASLKIEGVRGPRSEALQVTFQEQLKRFQKDRGRDLVYPFLASGIGRGPWVELLDGSVKYDMITGIGISFFGHSHPELMRAALDATASDIYQGNLEPGVEVADLLRALLMRVESSSRLRHGWITTCGTMANEIALKIIRQKKSPATKVIAFRDCFAGRSTAMQEITDNPKYREGQPLYGEAAYIPFYMPKLGLQGSLDLTLCALEDHLQRYPGKFAALMLEIVQGEGGFNYAPREFYLRVFEVARKAGLAIWADEIQSFGRTGELFAFQKFDLGEYVDVVTTAKMLHASAVLFSEEYNPKPGLVAGTFTGTSASLRVAKRILELLDDGFLGQKGRVSLLSERFSKNLEKMATGPHREFISDWRVIGGMVAVQPFAGTLDDVKAVLNRLFDLGVVAFQCGHGPMLIRMLPPLGAMNEGHVDEVCALLGQALQDVAAQRAARNGKS
ncbi:MAG: aminotransferase class III-fold pyridoxal phosphate-dependent enzyme [Oligoflexia bacterium]